MNSSVTGYSHRPSGRSGPRAYNFLCMVSAHLLIWYFSSRTKLTFYSADSRANYKDLSALQSDLPLGLCEPRTVNFMGQTGIREFQ